MFDHFGGVADHSQHKYTRQQTSDSHQAGEPATRVRSTQNERMVGGIAEPALSEILNRAMSEGGILHRNVWAPSMLAK